MLLAALFMPLALHAQQSLPYSCGFEDGDDTDGWAIYGESDGTGVYQGEEQAHGGSLFFGFRYDETNGYLVSPVFTGGDNGIDGSFWYKEYSNTYGDEQFQVGYTTDEEADPTEFTYDAVVTATTEWQEYTFSFPAGTKRIAVKYIYNDVHYLFLDDFDFWAHGAAVCTRPTDLAVTNVGSRTATLSWTSDASAWQICINDDESNLINTNQTTYPLNNLTPETDYTVKVRANCGNNNFSAWASVSFTTEVACPAPEVSIGDITANSANVSWTSNNNRFQFRYRVAPASNDFEDGELGIWTTIDADGDGYDWYTLAVDGISGHNNSLGIATSASYSSGALTPDNYLVSPRITLGGSISFYACAQDSAWAAEHFGVAVSTNGNINANDFTTIAEWTMNYEGTGTAKTQGLWGLYTVDLSAYAGQMGYVAIRHFDCTDMFRLNVDDITIVQPGVTEPQPWITDNYASSPKSLTGLNPQTIYQVQVLTDCTSNNDGYSVWTNDYFTTLPTCVAPTNLTVYNITTTDAWVSWDGEASRYIIKVNGQQYNNVTSPYHLTGLTAATYYTVEVQAVCTDASSSWTSTTFLTELCEEADKCVLTFELTDTYGDTWNGNAIKVVDVATNSVIATLTNDYDNYTATGASGAYTQTKELAVCNGRQIQFVWVRGNYPGEANWVITDLNSDTLSIGKGSNYNDGEIIKTYTVDCTVTSCRYPTNLTVASFTPTSATLTWTEKGEATSWVVSYTIGSRTRTINASTTEVTIPSLTPGTSFSAKVRPVCDVNNRWSDPINFTLPDNLFITNNGNWNEGSSWYGGAVPAEGSDVAILANAIVPAGYTAILGEEVIFTDGGSITVADGGQLINYDIEDLEVTMEKNVPAYTGDNDNYKLLAFPFTDYPDVPADMAFATGKDFYLFDNSQPGEEWQNNRADTIYYVAPHQGYLYANPTATTVSMSGTTYTTPEYGYGHNMSLTYNDTINEVNGWYLLGNPFTSNAYIYGASSNLFAMDVMYYDANGNMQTISAGPVPPMQGFFVKITENTTAWFLAEEYDLSSKAPLHAVVDKKADNAATTVDKKKAMKLKLINNPSARSKEFKPIKPFKK